MSMTRLSLLGCVLALLAPAAAQAAQVGAPAARLQVWNVNTRHMAIDSTSDWRQFAYYITDPARAAYLPDIVTLQEAGSPEAAASCHAFEALLEQRTGHGYFCYETGAQGGAAVVYRTSRLSHTTNGTKSLGILRISGSSCVSSPWRAMDVRLRDDLWSSRFVNVEAVHLPVAEVDGRDCAWDNNKLLDAASDDLGATTMRIMAGDWNHADATTTSTGAFSFWECQYKGLSLGVGTCGGRNLGWKDVIYRLCMNQGWGPGAPIYDNCLRYHPTFGSKRIDFMFTTAYAIYNQLTVPVTAPRYSDHRGHGALLSYGP
jgi:endonuclease/exonuclease/phosphatase family metal-dependent hydrolase